MRYFREHVPHQASINDLPQLSAQEIKLPRGSSLDLRSMPEKPSARADEICSVMTASRDSLEACFDKFFFQQEFGYTLLGARPMALGAIACTPEAEKNASLSAFPTRHEWRQFSQNKTAFLGSEFELRLTGEYMSGVAEVMFYQKSAVRACASEHLELLSRVCGQQLSVDEIMQRLERGGNGDALLQNHVLRGVFLGFGQKNAELFDKRREYQALTHNSAADKTEQLALEVLLSDAAYDFALTRCDSSHPGEVSAIQFRRLQNDEESELLQLRYQEAQRRLEGLRSDKGWFPKLLTLLEGVD